MTTYLIAGHGGTDPGAIAFDGTTEASLTEQLRTAIFVALQAELGAGGHELTALSGSPQYLEIAQDAFTDDMMTAIHKINASKPAGAQAKDGLSIDLHFNFNCPGASGAEVFYANNPLPGAKELAGELAAAVSAAMGITNRGAKTENQSQFNRLAMIEDIWPLALICETCFLNEHDLTLFRTPEIFDAVVAAYVRVLAAYIRTIINN